MEHGVEEEEDNLDAVGWMGEAGRRQSDGDDYGEEDTRSKGRWSGEEDMHSKGHWLEVDKCCFEQRDRHWTGEGGRHWKRQWWLEEDRLRGSILEEDRLRDSTLEEEDTPPPRASLEGKGLQDDPWYSDDGGEDKELNEMEHEGLWPQGWGEWACPYTPGDTPRRGRKEGDGRS